jgi:putative nucleotidyltransferase with HDIG domain
MKSIVFDWGDTLMKDYPQYNGPMKDWPQVDCLPGVPDSLATLFGQYKLYVATNASESNAADVFTALNRVDIAQLMNGVYTRNDLHAEKPSLKFFYNLVKTIKDPGLYFIGDDYQNDMLGASHAGLTTVWYNPKFYSAPAHYPIHDAEFSHFNQLPDILSKPFLPNLITCQHWLLEQGAGYGLMQHNQTVAAIAYQMALWCNENGQIVDPILVHRAAYLHDIGKMMHDETCQHHGESGAKLLKEKGFPELATIVEKHPLLCLQDEIQRPQTIEEILVYLADKYAEGSRIVPLEERLNHLVSRYPPQQKQILEIKSELFQLQNECCHWMGFTPTEILYQIQTALK